MERARENGRDIEGERHWEGKTIEKIRGEARNCTENNRRQQWSRNETGTHNIDMNYNLVIKCNAWEERMCAYKFIHQTIFVEIGCMRAYSAVCVCLSVSIVSCWCFFCSISPFLSFHLSGFLVHCYYFNMLFIKLELTEPMIWLIQEMYFHWRNLLVELVVWTLLRTNHMLDGVDYNLEYDIPFMMVC